MIDLPLRFKERMSDLLGGEADAFFSSYERPPFKGIRVNTLKISAKDFTALSPFALSPVEWEENGFYIDEDKPGKSIFHSMGLFYVQEPSAMCAAPLLEVRGGERVLDLCSAPGGKGTQLAQKMQGEGIIILNEINFERAKILSQNVERLGIKNAVVTCAPPQALSEIFVGWFDKILVDAPCSGEGMFKKEPNAIPEWSMENVKMCAERQWDILNSAKKMLKTGGRLVYSTCTFAPEEDEGQIESFLSENGGFKLIKREKLYPHKVCGEGHFAALLEKSDGEEGRVKLLTPSVKDKKLLDGYLAFERSTLKVSFKNLHLIGNTLYSLPDGMPELKKIQTLRAGVRLGEFVKDRFVPSHSLAMSLCGSQAEGVELDLSTAYSYLRGNTFTVDERLGGWRLALYKGFPLGWCKTVGGTAKNHLPKGLRIC